MPIRPRTSNDDQGNLVTDPTHLVIPTGKVRNAHLILVKSHSARHCFHIHFIPMIPRGRSRFTISDRRHSTCGRGLSTKIGIVAKFNAIFFIQPGGDQFSDIVSSAANLCQLHGGNGAIIIVSRFHGYSLGSRARYRPAAGRRVLTKGAFRFRGGPNERCHFGLIRNTTGGAVHVTDRWIYQQQAN